MANNNEKIERFIRKLLEIQNSKVSVNLNENGLKKIADDMGLTNDEWQKVIEIFNAHITRGKAFLKYKNTDDAIIEFEHAHTLMPNHAQTLFYLAYAHKVRYEQKDKDEDKNKALKYATQCANIQPSHHEAIRLISSLKTPKKAKSSPVARKIIFALLGGALILIVLVFITIDINGGDNEVLTEKEVVQENYSVSETNDSENHINKTDYTDNTNNTDNKNTQTVTPTKSDEATDSSPAVDVVFVDDANSKGLSIDVQRSIYSDYTSSYSYNIRGYIKVDNVEVNKLSLKFKLIDKNGKTIATETKKIVTQTDAVYRPGDIIPFYYIEYKKDTKLPEFEKSIVSINYVEKQPPAQNYEPTKPVEFEWDYDRPADYNIQIAERYSRFKDGYNNSSYHKVEWEVKNTGSRSIQLLKLNINWYDKNGKQLHNADHYICSTSDPLIKRGQTVVSSRTFAIKTAAVKDVDSYKITVIDIE